MCVSPNYSAGVTRSAPFSTEEVATEAGLLCPAAKTAGRATRAGFFKGLISGRARLLGLVPYRLLVCSSLVVVTRCLWLPETMLRDADAAGRGRRGDARRAAHARIFGAVDEPGDAERVSCI